jgi:hypothetical protein
MEKNWEEALIYKGDGLTYPKPWPHTGDPGSAGIAEEFGG